MRFIKMIGALALSAALANLLLPAGAFAADKVKYGNLRVANAVFVGMEKGFFASRNIEVEVIFFRSGAEVVPSLSTGQIDIGATTAGASLYNAMAQGVNAKIVADYIVLVPGHGLNAISVRKDLVDQGKFTKPADAKGLRFAITARGQVTQLFAAKFLEQGGLKESDVKLVALSYPDMMAAFKGGSIDLAAFVDPFITIAEQQALAVRFTNISEFMPNTNLGVLMYGNRLLTTDRSVGSRFMEAFAEANAYLRKALASPAGVKEIAAIYQKHLPLESAEMYEKASLGVGRANLLPDIDGPFGLRMQQQWYVDQGLVPTPPDLAIVVDPAFAREADTKFAK